MPDAQSLSPESRFWLMAVRSWRLQTAAALDVPKELFEHRAVLYTKDHLPFSEVDEVYHHDALDFQPIESQ